jgi:radical SAM superfamily enzyme YgiQ (UPF0313 family)
MKIPDRKLCLIFPPLASPTYQPLGLASLAAFIRQELPWINLTLTDLNLELWYSQLEQHSTREELLAFLRNTDNAFYKEELYNENHRRIWQELKTPIDNLLGLCRSYLEDDALPVNLKPYLDNETARILGEEPDIIGFSLMYPQQLFFTLALAKHIKEQSRNGKHGVQPLRIFLGGATLSAINSSELLTACSFIDAILLGEGEAGMKQLLTDTPYEAIPGLLYRENGSTNSPDTVSIKRNRTGCALELQHLPAPDFSLLPLYKYFNPQPVFPVLFSRGCRWRKCRFCAHNFSFARYRHKTVADLVTELEHYQQNAGAEHFYFADQYLGEDSLELIADELIRRKLHLFFHFMGRPTGGYSKALLDKLYKAGCCWISWGIESGSQRLLEIVNKGTCRDDILRLLRETHEVGINNLAMMIFGLPTSTDEDLQQTFAFMDSAASSIDAMTESEFTLYKHTPFANQAGTFGLKITGEEVLCRINGYPIHSHRLYCQSRVDPAREVAQWRRRKPWLFPPRLYEKLNAEHYLLYAAYRKRTTRVG